MKRRLSAILALDAVGYSGLMERDEAGTLAALKAYRVEVFDPAVARHGGRVVKLMGDGALVEFPSVVDALNCAIATQDATIFRDHAAAGGPSLMFRIGIALGDVVVEGDDIYGDGVNVAARLQELAEPGGICVTATVRDNVRGKLDVAFEDMGPRPLKNIASAVHVFKVVSSAPSAGPATAKAPAQRPTVAVLPFNNMSGDAEHEYFADGITEDIITELSRFRALYVIARNSSFVFKGTHTRVEDVARKLGVQYVVEGSVRRAGKRVRVTAQLVDGTTGMHIWAERYDRDLDDIFAVQDELTRSIVTALGIHVESATLERALRKVSDFTAYEYVLRARRPYEYYTKAMNEEARGLYLKALELDDGLTEARTRLALTYLSDAEFGWAADPEAAIRRGLEAAERAVERNPGDSYALHALSYAHSHLGHYDLAMRFIKRAYDFNPNDVGIMALLASALSYQGRSEEAIALIEEARRRNPMVPKFLMWNLGIALHTARRYREATEAFEQISSPPTEMIAALAACYAQAGDVDRARDLMKRYLALAREELAHFPGDDKALWRAYWRRSYQYSDEADLDHLLEGLRLAGLPV